MKNYKTLYTAFLTLLVILIANPLKAQTGLSRATAFEAGTLYPGAVFMNTQNNAPSFADFTGSGPFPNGIFYKFTLNATKLNQTIISPKP